MMARFSRQLFARCLWRGSVRPCPTHTGHTTHTELHTTHTMTHTTHTGLHTGHTTHTELHTDHTVSAQLQQKENKEENNNMDNNNKNMDYQEAVCALNTLQTNASLLDQVRRERLNPQLQLSAMRGFLERAGLTVEQLDQLNIIHVTGTKGKGSTCAFTEQILRSYGFRTGFYSSPHLVQVRERIRINGKPISRKLFTSYFWQVYGRLDDTKEAHGGSMPAYFRFLTIMAFHVFLQEKVDVAVIEVGIGGAYDCTNIIRRPWVCGISSLGIDHTQILGDTIEKIAWQKGGIFKPGVPAFTVRQTESSMAVLKDRAREIHCPLWVCPDLGQYVLDERAQQLHLVVGLAGRHQHSNASLALQLTSAWLHTRCETELCCDRLELQAARFPLSPVMVKGLAETSWPGRTQTMSHGSVTYFLDGAHTMRSMQACVEWFRDTAVEHETHALGPVARVLLFNATGERDCAAMLKLLLPCHFDFAVFCPNISETVSSHADQQNYNVSVENMLTRCLDNESSWRLHTSHQGEPEDQQQLLIQALPSRPLMAERNKAQTAVFPCILSALRWVSQGRDPVLLNPASSEGGVAPVKVAGGGVAVKAAPPLLHEAAEIHVLITGSLHLVGGALKHLDPASTN